MYLLYIIQHQNTCNFSTIIQLESLINTIRDACIVVITWGGALTNLVYLKENTKSIYFKIRILYARKHRFI